MARHVERHSRSRYDSRDAPSTTPGRTADDGDIGPAHAVYFATYEAVKHVMGGNKIGEHHPLAAATSGACATIASDALMNPFDGTLCPAHPTRRLADRKSHRQ